MSFWTPAIVISVLMIYDSSFRYRGSFHQDHQEMLSTKNQYSLDCFSQKVNERDKNKQQLNSRGFDHIKLKVQEEP